jgi:hypothetical protein
MGWFSIRGNAWCIAIVSILWLTAVPVDARSGTAHLLAHIRALLPKKTAVPVRLPRWIPNWIPESDSRLTAIMDADRGSYQVIIGTAGCLGTSLNCQAVLITGERLGRKPPKMDGIKLRLRNGLIGSYYPAQTGVGTSDSSAALEVDQNGCRYTLLRETRDASRNGAYCTLCI